MARWEAMVFSAAILAQLGVGDAGGDETAVDVEEMVLVRLHGRENGSLAEEPEVLSMSENGMSLSFSR